MTAIVTNKPARTIQPRKSPGESLLFIPRHDASSTAQMLNSLDISKFRNMEFDLERSEIIDLMLLAVGATSCVDDLKSCYVNDASNPNG